MSVVDAIGNECDEIPTLNFDLLEEAVSWAHWSSETDLALQKEIGYFWDQGSWARTSDQIKENEGEGVKAECGSSFCISGYAAMSSKMTTYDIEVGESTADDGSAIMVPHKTLALDRYKVADALELCDNDISDEEWDPDHWWSVVGQRLIGLTDGEANVLFNGENSIERIVELGNKIANNRGFEDLNLDLWAFKMSKKEVMSDGTEKLHGHMVKKDWYEEGFVSA